MFEQKQQCFEVCEYWSECIHMEGDNYYSRKKSWVYIYDWASKQQSTEERATKSTNKTAVITFFDYYPMIYNNTCPTKVTSMCSTTLQS